MKPRSAAQTEQAEELLFIRRWLANPLKVGALLPSSPFLAKTVARNVKYGPDEAIVEVGAGTGAVTKGLLKAAIRDPNPVIFLENEILYGRTFPVPKLDDYVLPIGKARVVREGAHVTLVAHSISVGTIIEAAEILAKDGIEAELIDLRSLRPLDTATIIESVKKTNRIVTVEQGWPICSIGSEIAAAVVDGAFDYLDAPPARINGKDVPMPYAANLEKLALPTVDDVVAAAKAVLYR